jgi:Flp pilus assembly protein TadD
VLATQGWEAFRRGNLGLALESFNQSKLLNPKNYGAYWGVGAVLSEQGKLAEALEQLETAKELNDERSQRVALLTDLGAVYSEHATRLPLEKQLDRAQNFVLANQRFTEGLEIDPNYAASWREWAISLYRQERFSEAWIKARRATELKSEPFPPGFLKVLESKLRESK